MKTFFLTILNTTVYAFQLLFPLSPTTWTAPGAISFVKLFLPQPFQTTISLPHPSPWTCLSVCFSAGLNDLLSSSEVSQDWPSSMHDHMSSPFNISIQQLKNCCTSVLLYFLKAFLLPTESLQIYFHVRRQSLLSRGLKSPMPLCPMEKLHRLLLL